tara:strand:+ start:852 stop:1031 length:180 start_codon:yes stop_codon:yes gene_type:complete
MAAPTHKEMTRIVNDVMTIVWYENRSANEEAVPILMEQAIRAAMHLLVANHRFMLADSE